MYAGEASKNAHYLKYSIHYSCPIGEETEMEQQIFIQLVNIKSNEKTSAVIELRWMDGRTDGRKERLILIRTLQAQNGTSE
jgi:hypothetical protein